MDRAQEICGGVETSGDLELRVAETEDGLFAAQRRIKKLESIVRHNLLEAPSGLDVGKSSVRDTTSSTRGRVKY